MKICDMCKTEKEYTEFNKNRARKDGVQTYCRKCSTDRNNKNRDKLRADSRTYYKENKQEILVRSAISVRKDTNRFRQGKYVSEKGGYIWDLTIDQWRSVVSKNSCHYCEGSLPETGHALNRKDSTVGYMLGNVVACCFACNKIKNNTVSYLEMVAIAKVLREMRSV